MKIKLLSLGSILCLTPLLAFTEYSGSAQIAKGKAQVQIENLFSCENGHSNLTSYQTALLCNVPVDVITKLENNSGGVTLDSFLKVINGLSINIELTRDNK